MRSSTRGGPNSARFAGEGIEWGSGVFTVRVPKTGLDHAPDPATASDWLVIAYLSVDDPSDGDHTETWFTIKAHQNGGMFANWSLHAPTGELTPKSLLFTHIGDADPTYQPPTTYSREYDVWVHTVQKNP